MQLKYHTPVWFLTLIKKTSEYEYACFKFQALLIRHAHGIGAQYSLFFQMKVCLICLWLLWYSLHLFLGISLTNTYFARKWYSTNVFFEFKSKFKFQWRQWKEPSACFHLWSVLIYEMCLCYTSLGKLYSSNKIPNLQTKVVPIHNL